MKIIDLEAFVPQHTDVKLPGGRVVKMYSALDIPYIKYLEIISFAQGPEDEMEPADIMAEQISRLIPELNGPEEVKQLLSLAHMKMLLSEAMNPGPLAHPVATEETTTETTTSVS